MDESLPNFDYFRDPLGAGTFIPSDVNCLCCNRARGYIYQGPIYSSCDELDDQLCPWCIADGSAAKKFDATFLDERGIGGYGDWEPVSEKIIEIVLRRTPCFTPWQSESWWTHCGDAAVFVDYAGRDELIEYGEQCIENIRESLSIDDENWAHVFENLRKDGAAIAYVFQCRHCGQYGGYWDCM